jgi:2-oxoglutarate ferredoxin oxidoreductase subunit beta
MNGLATIIEEGIRYPGFAFINVQSPCVTYGQEDQMLKAQKATMQTLASINHDPANRLAAMDLAQAYGEKLYTGVFYRRPEPEPTFERLARERQEAQRPLVKGRADVLNVFRLKKP